MNHDSINEEILRIKRELASKFDNDLARIVADTRSRERNSISMPPRPWKSAHIDAPKLPNDAGLNCASSTETGDCQR
ncbi:MAG: hypothetical protein ACK5YR_15980 [Pirellula sp.]|jgi:hypothetical protein